MIQTFFKHGDNRLVPILQTRIEYLTCIVSYVVHFGYYTEMGFVHACLGQLFKYSQAWQLIVLSSNE